MRKQIFTRVVLTPVFIVLLAVIVLAAGTVGAEEMNRWQVGGRLGFDDGRNDEDFNQVEMFLAYLLPVSLGGDLPLSFAVSLEGSAGLISGGSTEGFVGAVGPGLAVGFWDDRLLLKAGVSPTFISKDNYGEEDLGGPVQFTSHIGLAAKVYRGLSVGYRLQHMSNAGLYDHNPGLNLHMVEIGWWF